MKGDQSFIEKQHFGNLAKGYFNAKHKFKPTKEDVNELFDRIDTGRSGTIRFEEFDIFVKSVYEIEFLPKVESEMIKRGMNFNEEKKVKFASLSRTLDSKENQ